MSWLILLIALAAGASNPLQSAGNSELQNHWHQSLWTTAWVYSSGLAGTLLLLLVLRQPRPATSTMAQTPWWAWLGGLASIAATLAGLTLARRLGAGVFTGATLTASITVSLLLDAMGWLGFKQHPLTPLRLLGGVLMIAGLWCIAHV